MQGREKNIHVNDFAVVFIYLFIFAVVFKLN